MDEIRNRIITKLNAMGEDYSNQKTYMMEHLTALETYLIDLEEQYIDAIKLLKLKSLSIKAIANRFGISRTTLYNHNQLLKRYIEYSSIQLRKNNPLDIIKAHKDTISQLCEERDRLYDRDVNLEIKKHEIKELSNKLKEKDKQIRRLEARNIELGKQIHELKQRYRTSKVMKIRE